MNESEFLDKDELVELTGHKQARAQATWLMENDIHFFINGKGTPVVGRHYLRQRMAGNTDEAASVEQMPIPIRTPEHHFKFRG